MTTMVGVDPKGTFVLSAAEVRSEPILTDAAGKTNDGFGEHAAFRRSVTVGSGRAVRPVPSLRIEPVGTAEASRAGVSGPEPRRPGGDGECRPRPPS